jgi:phage-related baseplate assembly protein
VLILSQMPSAQRAKLIGEFKTDAEAETLAEILKLIREGVPETALIDDTEQKLNQADEAARPAADAAP